MERSTNALAELADELEAVYAVANRGCTEETCFGKVVRKAQRIVAELAKVHINEIKEYPFDALGAFVILMAECRAIAEEGAGDGK